MATNSRKKVVLSTLFGSCFAVSSMMTNAGCSSTIKNETSQTQAMTQAQQSEPSPVYRAIASSMDPEILESAFQKIINAKDPQAEMSNTVNRVLRIYYRAESYLKEYDLKLDQVLANPSQYPDNAMQTDDSYAKLVSAWILSEQTRASVSHAYYRLMEMSESAENQLQVTNSDRTGLSAGALMAKKALQNSVSSGAKGAHQIGLQGLYRDLLATAEAFTDRYFVAGTDPSFKPQKPFLGSLEKNTFSNPKLAQKFMRANDSELSNNVAKALGDAEITKEIEALAPFIKSHLDDLSDSQSRSPQSVGAIFPSSGSSGNINGGTFSPGRWALTYDDGPHGVHTGVILSELVKHNVKATFFWLAQHTDRMPSIVNRAKSLGMELANHSYTHANLPKTTDLDLRREVVSSTLVQATNYGVAPTFFRCPYGACGPASGRIRNLIAAQNMIHVFWNVDSLDWQDRNPVSIYQRVKKQMEIQRRGIILFHDIHPQTVEATRMLMNDWAPEIRAGRMRMLTVGEAVDELNSPGGMR